MRCFTILFLFSFIVFNDFVLQFGPKNATFLFSRENERFFAAFSTNTYDTRLKNLKQADQTILKGLGWMKTCKKVIRGVIWPANYERWPNNSLD